MNHHSNEITEHRPNDLDRHGVHSSAELQERLKRLRLLYPGRDDEELIAIGRFLDRYIEIALSIYLEATKPLSPEAD
jgi:hypothetical protein